MSSTAVVMTNGGSVRSTTTGKPCLCCCQCPDDLPSTFIVSGTFAILNGDCTVNSSCNFTITATKSGECQYGGGDTTCTAAGEGGIAIQLSFDVETCCWSVVAESFETQVFQETCNPADPSGEYHDSPDCPTAFFRLTDVFVT